MQCLLSCSICHYANDNHNMVLFFQDALLQHTKSAVNQGSIWTTSHQSSQDTPSPGGWDWTLREEMWIPVWCNLPMVSKACSELVKCSCKRQSGFAGRCSCKNASLNCTDLCGCNCVKQKNCKNVFLQYVKLVWLIEKFLYFYTHYYSNI